MNCKLCEASQDNEWFVFCSIKCQYVHYEVFEKMNHLFIKGLDDKCATCARSYLDHTPAARCESCKKCGSCSIINDLLLCDSCATAIKSNQFDLIQESRTIDSQLLSNQDFHNAATVPIIELKQAIMEDDSILNKDEALKNELLIRYEQFSTRIFELNNELLTAQLTKSIIRHNLDDIAYTIRQEERERIKIADANYTPPVRTKAVKIPKAPTAKKSVFENMVASLAELRNISETEARLIIQQGATRMNKKLDIG